MRRSGTRNVHRVRVVRCNWTTVRPDNLNGVIRGGSRRGPKVEVAEV